MVRETLVKGHSSNFTILLHETIDQYLPRSLTSIGTSKTVFSWELEDRDRVIIRQSPRHGYDQPTWQQSGHQLSLSLLGPHDTDR